MPAAQWALAHGRPVIEALLPQYPQGRMCRLVADTGAGSQQSVFELILDERICLACGGIVMGHIQLGGAYSGTFPVYLIQVRMAALNFDEPVPTVGVRTVPSGTEGIAGFKFLNRFQYGNFGNAAEFGLNRLATPTTAV